MSSDATTPPAPALEIMEPLCAVFRKKLRSEGLKYTPERAQVLDAILRMQGVFEAERVIEAARGGGVRVSKATVYRTLKLLMEAGIIQRVMFDREQAHFQLVYATSPDDLLLRIDTGEAIPIEVPELAALCEALCRARGLVAKGHRLHVFAGAPG